MGQSPDIVLVAFVAALGSAVIAWSAPAAAADTFTLGFTGPDSLCARPGEVRSAEFTCTLAQVGTGPGAQGWSIGMTADGAAITAITTDGTDAAPVAEGGLQSGGFEKTELTTKAKAGSACEGRNGAVSSVVLSFKQTITLRPNGVESVLRLTTELPPSAGGGEARTRLFFKDGLQGSGQPVSNTATVGGSTRFPCNRSCADVTIVAACCAQPRFVRGNANDDGRLDIADPIWIIQELFRLGPPAACEAAADANGDGMVDASDALYLIAYEFAAGPTPPPPFPECGIGSDGILPCTAAQSACW